MFGGARRVVDPTLGELTRRGRSWHGVGTTDDGVSVPVVVPGSRSSPDGDAVAIVSALLSDYAGIRPLLRDALADHRPDPLSADQVARLVVPHPVFARVLSLGGQEIVELGYEVEWDDEHTLGARFHNGEFIELNGSVLPPNE